jgi:predicted PurR-regulated permease PerM
MAMSYEEKRLVAEVSVFQDIVVGVVLALVLMVPVVPLVDAMDHYLLTSHWSPAILLTTGICLVVFYPNSDRWTPTR